MLKNTHEQILFESIYSSVSNTLLQYLNKDDIDIIFDKTMNNKEHVKSICLLPYWFFNCFENRNNIEIENELFILGKANLQMHIAYDLYDYIRNKDFEKDHYQLYISVSNILIKKSIKTLYQLVNNDKNKISIIDNLFNNKDIYHIDKTIVVDIHYHFKYLTDNIYRKSMITFIAPIIVLWLMGYKIRSNNYNETFNFFANYLNSQQLIKDDKNLCDNVLNNVYTPATFLMRVKYSSDYIHTMLKSRIEFFTQNAIESLKKLHFFDYNKFIKLYIKDYENMI